jgi:cobyrinic acid a,c-diamide synthase
MVDRLVIAAPQSGAGKTTVATGLMAAFVAAGRTVAGFKVGPDFIDPSYHALATGRPGRNLDSFLSGTELIGPLFAHGARGCDLAIVEGVMGLFDGKAGAGELASTAQIAKLIEAPVVLVIDARALARSVAALVLGFATYDPQLRIAGVVLNMVGSPRHEQLLREALAATATPVLGVVRRRDVLENPGRHLGLVPAAERAGDAERTVRALGALMAQDCDLAGLAALAASAPRRSVPAWDAAPPVDAPAGSLGGRPARIAVAGGPVFTFNYQENLELLAARGAEVTFFDPAAAECLPGGPEGPHGLLIGGGFPESHGEALAANEPMRAAVRAFAASGRPLIAECGGLLYLCRSLDGRPMCGVIDAEAQMGRRLTLGYRSVVAASPSAIAVPGQAVRGHEFHYSTLSPGCGAAPAWRDGAVAEGFVAGGVHASYLHTHWAAFPQLADRLVAACQAAAAGEAPGPPAAAGAGP